ncbi:MAG: 16S rRNA (uracil(1498)-N(3))-methyltransferase [Flavobacteriales bacterium]|nr:16S rRNA (uracil(1498)-N(3))-methyltransferase [Flavobacteriales bacterium]
MHIFYTPNLSQKERSHILDKDESHHCIKVLRLKTGDQINTIDGIGGFYTAEITNDNPKKCEIKILSSIQEYGKREQRLHIAIAPTKNINRIEWFIEKATEVGIDEVSFIQCDQSERNHFTTKRLHKIILGAVKQSQQAYLPIINELITAKEFIRQKFTSQKLIASCAYMETNGLSKKYTNGDALILIGPEGDFSERELILAEENGFEAISLGSTRLRTETAALTACISINLLND